MDRIAAYPPPHTRSVFPIFILTKPSNSTPWFGAEAVGEGGGEVAGLDDDFTEGGVFVVGVDGAVGGEVFSDVSVGVVAWQGCATLTLALSHRERGING